MNVEASLIEAHIFRIVNDRMEFLLLKRAENEKYPGIWQMVTGSIEDNEKAFEAALREINEETSLTPLNFWVVPNINSFYWTEKDVISTIPVFAALVQPDAKVLISEEHCMFKWVEKNEALCLLAWPGQHKSVEIIHDYFMQKKYFLNFVEINIR
jgi:dihydroneopterin triphosphate diphosphatase